MQKWKRIEPTIVSKIGWRTVVSKTFQLPDGTVHDFQTISAEDSAFAGTIAVTPDGKVVVARQFRPGPERIMDEIPGGVLEPGENPEATARRELLEETGYEAGDMVSLGAFSGDAYSNATWHYFLATHCVPSGGQELDSTEHAEVHLISIDEFIDNAMNDRMTDPVAVLKAYERLQELKGGTHAL